MVVKINSQGMQDTHIAHNNIIAADDLWSQGISSYGIDLIILK